MPLFSVVVVTYFNLMVVLSPNGQFLCCAAVACGERYHACISSCRKGLGVSFFFPPTLHYSCPSWISAFWVHVILSVGVHPVFLVSKGSYHDCLRFSFTINMNFSVCSVVFTFSVICLWLYLATDTTVTF